MKQALHSRRAWLCGALAFAALIARPAGAATVVEQRAVAGFDRVLWEAIGELEIEQTGRERLAVEAEPAVLRQIVTEVRQGRLSIGFKPGRIESREPIRFRLEVKSLAAFESTGSGDVRIGPWSGEALSLRLAGSDDVVLRRVQGRSLEARLEGAGELVVQAGRVERQRVVIEGSTEYRAEGLACGEAEVVIEGSADARLGRCDRLQVRIGGSGTVTYRGQPQIRQRIDGAGSVQRAD